MLLNIIIDSNDGSATLRCNRITEYNYVLAHLTAIADSILRENSTVKLLTVLVGNAEMFQMNPLADKAYRDRRKLGKLRANLEIIYKLDYSQSASVNS